MAAQTGSAHVWAGLVVFASGTVKPATPKSVVYTPTSVHIQ